MDVGIYSIIWNLIFKIILASLAWFLAKLLSATLWAVHASVVNKGWAGGQLVIAVIGINNRDIIWSFLPICWASVAAFATEVLSSALWAIHAAMADQCGTSGQFIVAVVGVHHSEASLPLDIWARVAAFAAKVLHATLGTVHSAVCNQGWARGQLVIAVVGIDNIMHFGQPAKSHFWINFFKDPQRSIVFK